MRYAFPGNVRELRNILENAVVMSNDDQIDTFIHSSLMEGQGFSAETQGAAEKTGQTLSQQVAAAEKQILVEAGRQCRTTREMARFLGISQPSVVRKLRRHDIPLLPIQK